MSDTILLQWVLWFSDCGESTLGEIYGEADCFAPMLLADNELGAA